MNTLPTLAFWGQNIARLAIEGIVLVGVAEILQRFTQSSVGWRAIWRTTLLAPVLISLSEISGLSRMVTFRRSVSRTREVALGNVPSRNLARLAAIREQSLARSSDKPLVPGNEELAGGNSPRRASSSIPFAAGPAEPRAVGEQAVWWPGWIWLAGIGALAARILAGRYWFWWVQSRPPLAPAPAALTEEIERLARRVGLRRPVRVVLLRLLASPIAFGTWRPAIGLPEVFPQFRVKQRAVMLMHELAHLRSGDPQWRWLADLVLVVLWWPPAAWWAHRQFIHPRGMPGRVRPPPAPSLSCRLVGHSWERIPFELGPPRIASVSLDWPRDYPAAWRVPATGNRP